VGCTLAVEEANDVRAADADALAEVALTDELVLAVDAVDLLLEELDPEDGTQYPDPRGSHSWFNDAGQHPSPQRGSVGVQGTSQWPSPVQLAPTGQHPVSFVQASVLGGQSGTQTNVIAS